MIEDDNAKCDVVMRNHMKCGRSVVDDKGKCICHSDLPDKDIFEFQHELTQILSDRSIDSYDLTGFIFPSDDFDIVFPKLIEKPIYFDNAIINSANGYIDFSDTRFIQICSFVKTIFKCQVDFTRTIFQQRVIFHSTDFKGEVYFTDSKFNFHVMFYETIFRGELHFAASFDEFIRFSKVKFIEQGSIYFGQATFSKGVAFEGIIVNKPFNISHIHINSYIMFNKITFESSFCMQNVIFEYPVYFSEIIFKESSSFNGSVFKMLTEFDNCNFNGDSQFLGVQFLGEARFYRHTSFNNVSFENMIVGEDSILLFEGAQ